MLTKKLTKIIVLIAVLSIALYGCRGERTGTDEQKTPADDQSFAEPNNETSLGDPIYGGSVTVGITQDLDSLDPHKAVAAGTKEVLFNIYEGLVKLNQDGNLVLAVADSYDISPDGLVYTFTLREGVKFHNGQPVTAEDIVYSIKRSAGMLEPVDPTIAVETALSIISDVVVVDEKTVEIQLSQADTELLPFLTSAIVPADYKELDSYPIGTGPFAFVSYAPLENIEMVKNQNYYVPGVPYLDRVVFKMSANTDMALLELRAGTIDILPYLTDAQANQLPEGYRLEAGAMNLIHGMFLNNDAPPFDNVTVRRALSYAIDRQAVIDMVFGGRGNVIGTNMFPGFKKYYDESLVEVYNFDPSKAKTLLAEAGFPNGFNFTIMVPSNYQPHVDTAQVIVEQLKESGITAEIQLIDWASWLSDVYKARNYQATIIGLTAEAAPKKALDRFQSDAGNNFINYKSEEFDQIYQLGEKTTNVDDKVAYYKQLQGILTNDAASVYIQDPYQMTAISNKLDGYTYYPIYVQDMSLVYYVTEQ